MYKLNIMIGSTQIPIGSADSIENMIRMLLTFWRGVNTKNAAAGAFVYRFEEPNSLLPEWKVICSTLKNESSQSQLKMFWQQNKPQLEN